MLHSKELHNFTKDLSVLFAEDHEDLRENVTEILSSFFNRVDSAENGEEALKKYKKSRQILACHWCFRFVEFCENFI